MNEVAISELAQKLHKMSLEELFNDAESFGRVLLSQMDSGQWYCKIQFQTKAGIDLKAASEFDHIDKRDAIRLAIVRANEIKDQFKS